MKCTTYSKPEQGENTISCKRDRISKAIKEYDERFDKSTNEGAFFVSDLQVIRNMSDGDVYTMIGNAFKAAFVIGDRHGRRAEKARACCQHKR